MMKFKIAALPADKVKRELQEAVREYADRYNVFACGFARANFMGDHRTAATHMKGMAKYQLRADNARKILQSLSN